jgi:hypothetical protein
MICLEDISFINPYFRNPDELNDLFRKGRFSSAGQPEEYPVRIEGLSDYIQNPVKKRMSQLSQGIYAVMETGPGKNLKEEDEIYFFSAFAEIDTTNEIIKAIELDHSVLVSPTHFHNSVHNTPLGYYAILKKIHNYTCAVSDGTLTGHTFINFIRNQMEILNDLIICSGEEYSDFFLMDRINHKKIIPSFIAYRMKITSRQGFEFAGSYDHADDLMKKIQSADFVFADSDTFSLLKNKEQGPLYTEKSMLADIPEGIIYRIALPFLLNLKGRGFVIDLQQNQYHVFEFLL